MVEYRKSFYHSLESQGLNSAREVLPFLFQLFKLASVVDVGCVIRVQELGVKDVLLNEGTSFSSKPRLTYCTEFWA